MVWASWNYAHLGTDQRHVFLGGQNVLTIQQDLAFCALLRIQLEHAVEGAQQVDPLQTRGADKGGDLVLRATPCSRSSAWNLPLQKKFRLRTDLLDFGCVEFEPWHPLRKLQIFFCYKAKSLTEQGASQDVQNQHPDRDQEHASPGSTLPVFVRGSWRI